MKLKLAIPPIFRKIMVSYTLLMPWGLPLALIGVPQYLSVQIIIATLLPFIAFQIYSDTINGRAEKWGLAMLAFVLYCWFVSAISNSFFLPVSLDAWLPGLAYIIPLLLIYAFRCFGINVKDAIDGLVMAAVFAALLVVIDRIVPLTSLNMYLHTASQDSGLRRLVILHNEMAFAVVVLIARILSPEQMLVSIRIKNTVINTALLVLVGYVLIIVSESRLANSAMIIAVILFMLFVYQSRRKLIVLAYSFMAVTLSIPVLFAKYFAYAGRVSSLSTQDGSVIYRKLEMAYFQGYFEKTHGLGFGLMYMNPKKENMLSFALTKGSLLLNSPDYLIGLIDTRIMGALYQFGYIGFITVIVFTAVIVLKLYFNSKCQQYPHRFEVGAIAVATLAFMISPLPLNILTADNTIVLGGYLWFLCFKSTHDVQNIKMLRPRANHPLHGQKNSKNSAKKI